MPTTLIPGEDDQTAVMALIGYVCIQWAVLETTFLHLIGAIELMLPEEAYIVFAGLDCRQRISKSLVLSRHHKFPNRLTNRIEQLRKDMDKADIFELRNTVVHGAHAASEQPHSTKIMMARYSGPKRFQDFSITDLRDIGENVARFALEAQLIFEDYGKTSRVKESTQHLAREFKAGNLGLWVKIKQHFRSRA
ncbi:hypothetical protein EEB18_016635 [Sphingopyxis sp. OPL5]|uniref:hypothetical protein n=1 Tax=Sphingopyxis sp. OPL5 TaxID=2486273 RepID=UPI00164DD709|nr:hypothetical protein [Sphingopyxis sp. OPL5]QNO26371.1 hypothetical protein EEB18_016635 [Sphingopyxis sp. OPL5]